MRHNDSTPPQMNGTELHWLCSRAAWVGSHKRCDTMIQRLPNKWECAALICGMGVSDFYLCGRLIIYQGKSLCRRKLSFVSSSELLIGHARSHVAHSGMKSCCIV
eukprot:1136751-Pelagomonas_calceolata.AAC.2